MIRAANKEGISQIARHVGRLGFTLVVKYFNQPGVALGTRLMPTINPHQGHQLPSPAGSEKSSSESDSSLHHGTPDESKAARGSRISELAPATDSMIAPTNTDPSKRPLPLPTGSGFKLTLPPRSGNLQISASSASKVSLDSSELKGREKVAIGTPQPGVPNLLTTSPRVTSLLSREDENIFSHWFGSKEPTKRQGPTQHASEFIALRTTGPIGHWPGGTIKNWLSYRQLYKEVKAFVLDEMAQGRAIIIPRQPPAAIPNPLPKVYYKEIRSSSGLLQKQHFYHQPTNLFLTLDDSGNLKTFFRRKLDRLPVDVSQLLPHLPGNQSFYRLNS